MCPIEVAKQPVVLIQNPEKEIYGPAHNAVLQIPGTDEWRIVYHRINKWYLKDGPGVHREVCIDQCFSWNRCFCRRTYRFVKLYVTRSLCRMEDQFFSNSNLFG